MQTLNKALRIHGVRTDQHPCPGGAGSLVLVISHSQERVAEERR